MDGNLTVRSVADARVKVWLEIENDYIFGRGICEILQAVQDAGSIKEAAGKVGKSYRHVWARIKDAEQAIGKPLVVSQVGGKVTRRTELTPLANELVRDFLELRQSVIEHAQQQFTRRFGCLRR